MGTPEAIITMGYGSWGSIGDVITLGYGSGEEANTNYALCVCATHGFIPGSQHSHAFIPGAQYAAGFVPGPQASQGGCQC